jgi:hypothetical protein
VPERSLPLVLPMAPLSAPALLLAGAPLELVEGVSSQSMWTGLAEWSFAAPVSLSASLPALGFLKELQSGLAASLLPIVRVAELGSLSPLDDCDADCEDAPLACALFVFSAIAGNVTPSAAARAIVLRNWLRIMDFLLLDNRESALPAAAHRRCGIPAAPWLRRLVRTV